MRRTSRLTMVGATLLLLASAAPALATTTTPVDNGCPASAPLIAVAWLEAQDPDYRLPAILDNPANGGNGDGYICGFPMPEATADGQNAPVPIIYNQFENNLPAEGRP